MRDLIKNQLKQVTYANLSNFDEATQTFIIPKYSEPRYEVGKMYLVQLPISIINQTNSVLATNWNNCSAPSGQYLKVYVSKMMGKMIYVDSLVFNFETNQDTSIMWSGWLPSEEITQISAL